MYANNSVIDINLVGEGYPGLTQITDGGGLECHTDDTTCCRRRDHPLNITGNGEWFYPSGAVVPPADDNNNKFYRTRGYMVVRLNRIGNTNTITQDLTGMYRCEIPGSNGTKITRYIELINNGSKLIFCRAALNNIVFSLSKMF